MSWQVPITETRAALRVDQHVTDGVELAHRTIRPDDAFAVGKPPTALHRGGHFALHAFAIVRMDAREEALEANLHLAGFQSEDTVQLVRPGHLTRCQVPVPAADMGDLLGRIELTLQPECHVSGHQRILADFLLT